MEIISSANYKRSAKHLDRFARAIAGGEVAFNYHGRSGTNRYLARSWSTIVGVAARRCNDLGTGKAVGAKYRVRSAKRLLKLARKIRNGSVSISTTFRCTEARLVVGAQRLLTGLPDSAWRSCCE